MKKKRCIIGAALLLLLMTGCADEGVTTDFLEWMATSEVSLDETTEEFQATAATTATDATIADDIAVDTTATDATIADDTATDITSERTESMTESGEKRYQGENYTFYEAPDDVSMDGSFLLFNVYEEQSRAEYHGLFVGQVITLFGDKGTSEDNEALFDYTIAAENKNGDVIYLTLYYGPSGPAIGGYDGDNYMEAAKELEEIVRSTEPIDFECASVYEDVGVTIRMGTRNGKGFYETEMPEDWESEFQ